MTENTPRRGPASPLHEAISVWRSSQQGTVEDLAELDRILSEYRHEDTALAYIAARVDEEDVPLHVAADIDQMIWEQSFMVVTRQYGIASDRFPGNLPDVGWVDSTEEARQHLEPWMEGHIVTRVTVESRLWEPPAHVGSSPATAGA